MVDKRIARGADEESRFLHKPAGGSGFPWQQHLHRFVGSSVDVFDCRLQTLWTTRHRRRALQVGPKTNYPGDERTTSFIFLLEDGAWKLDDVYTFRGKFAHAESLNQYFREK
jgi:hypothetical protein